jgi:hypothetical protein
MLSIGDVPFTSFSEFNKDSGGDIWFALGESPCFAGLLDELKFRLEGQDDAALARRVRPRSTDTACKKCVRETRQFFRSP